MRLRAVLFGILMVISALPLGAGERLTLKVSPAVALAPANLVEFRSLPPGTYQVRASLLGADGRSRAMIRQQVNVLASGTSER